MLDWPSLCLESSQSRQTELTKINLLFSSFEKTDKNDVVLVCLDIIYPIPDLNFRPHHKRNGFNNFILAKFGWNIWFDKISLIIFLDVPIDRISLLGHTTSESKYWSRLAGDATWKRGEDNRRVDFQILHRSSWGQRSNPFLINERGG